MIFKQMLPGQKLILVRIEKSRPPIRPLVARPAPRGQRPESILICLILWLVATLGRPTLYTLRRIGDYWPPPIWADLRTLVLVTPILFNAILEVLAADYLSETVRLVAL